MRPGWSSSTSCSATTSSRRATSAASSAWLVTRRWPRGRGGGSRRAPFARSAVRTTARLPACSSEPPRSSRRLSSTSSSRPSSALHCSGWARETMRCDARMPSPRAPRRPGIWSASCARGSWQARLRRASAEGAKQELTALVDEALPAFRAAGNDLALYIAYDARLGAVGRAVRCVRMRRTSRPSPMLDRPVRAAGSLGVARQQVDSSARHRQWELLEWLDANEAAAGRDHFFASTGPGHSRRLGRFDEARRILAESRAELAERGGGILLANITAAESVWVELWAGDPAAAAEFAAEGMDPVRGARRPET